MLVFLSEMESESNLQTVRYWLLHYGYQVETRALNGVRTMRIV